MNYPPRILVVDDIPLNIQPLSQLLGENGYEAQVISKGNEIYDVLESYKPDIILLDVIMPDANGYDICRNLKQDKSTSEIPVIFLTAMTETDDIIKGLEAGGVDYITKPFRSVEVLARIRTHLKMKEMHEKSLVYQRELLMTQKMSSITTLAGGIAHNINNLMGAVVGYTDMLRLSLNGQDKTRNYTERILEASQRVTELTQNLLTYSRSIRSEPTNVNVKDILGDLILLYGNGKSKNVKINANIPDDMSKIYVDRDQVFRALANIFVNAQEATSEGNPISISANSNEIPVNTRSETSNTKTDEYVVISISDNGPGMDESTANKVFEPFFTTKQTVGSGLGLSAASGIIQKNNGFIHLDTEIGKGSTFHVYLPKGKEEAV